MAKELTPEAFLEMKSISNKGFYGEGITNFICELLKEYANIKMAELKKESHKRF